MFIFFPKLFPFEKKTNKQTRPSTSIILFVFFSYDPPMGMCGPWGLAGFIWFHSAPMKTKNNNEMGKDRRMKKETSILKQHP